MLKWIDGFDAITDGNNAFELKYDSPIFTSFPQVLAGTPAPAGAREGNSLCLFNTGFGSAELLKILGATATIGVHVDYQILTNGTSLAGLEWIKFVSGSSKILSIFQRTDGRFEIRKYSGSLFTILATPARAFAPDFWTNIEIKVHGGHSGTWALRADGATIASGSADFGAALPDRVILRAEHFGPPAPRYDNYVIWDGAAGDGVSDWIGPSRITTLFVAGDAGGSWNRNGAGARYLAVQDRSHRTGSGGGGDAPDFDATYISPAAAGAKAYFLVELSPCYARNLGLALNVVARATAGGPDLNGLANIGGAEYVLGSTGALGSSYKTKQMIAVSSPATGGIWLDTDITRAQWGVGADASTGVRVTQIYVEKLSSLGGAPYSCGGGSSYSFSR